MPMITVYPRTQAERFPFAYWLLAYWARKDFTK